MKIHMNHNEYNYYSNGVYSNEHIHFVNTIRTCDYR